MAIAKFASPVQNRPLIWAAALIAQVRAEMRAQRAYGQTLRNLRSLSAQERAGPGIAWNMITRLAAEAA